MNELNSDLQAGNQFVNEMFGRTTFKKQLPLWDQQLQSNNTAHFPLLRTGKPTDAKHMRKKFSSFNKTSTLLFKIY
jgi:hypothetical protein